MKTTTTKSNSKVNTEKEQLLNRILSKKKTLAPTCGALCAIN
jgi:hypothetical protein